MNNTHEEEQIYVQLVKPNGERCGFAEKISAHLNGQLHLAFSILFFKKTHDGVYYLLQKRAGDKYHSGGLWTNTCCSHPQPNETIVDAAKRRLVEELGIQNDIDFVHIEDIIYKAQLDNDMIEHEYDAILAAQPDSLDMQLNPEEVSSVRWWHQNEIEQVLQDAPDMFTVWFSKVYYCVKTHANA